MFSEPLDQAELARILARGIVNQRHTAQLAYQRRKDYEKHFSRTSPEWVTRLAASRAGDVFELALKQGRHLPDTGPDPELIDRVVSIRRPIDRARNSSLWDTSAPRLHSLLDECTSGPYDKLLDGILCLNAKISDSQVALPILSSNKIFQFFQLIKQDLAIDSSNAFYTKLEMLQARVNALPIQDAGN